MTTSTLAPACAATATRLASGHDSVALGVLFDLYRQFYALAPDLARATAYIGERLANKESIVLVAHNAAGDLLGFLQMYPTFCSLEAAPICALYDLFVSPARRKTGAGRALLLAAEAYAAEHGFVRMDLTTAKDNVAAQSLYESLGWVRDTVFFAYNRNVSL